MTREDMLEYRPSEQENMRLQQENVLLQQENVRLQQEVNDIKRQYAYMERQLSRASYRILTLRSQQQSSVSLGQVLTAISVLAAVCLLFYYGMGIIDFPEPSSIEYDNPVVERYR